MAVPRKQITLLKGLPNPGRSSTRVHIIVTCRDVPCRAVPYRAGTVRHGTARVHIGKIYSCAMRHRAGAVRNCQCERSIRV